MIRSICIDGGMCAELPMRLPPRSSTGSALLASLLAAILFCCTIVCEAQNEPPNTDKTTSKRTMDWPVYGGQPANDHYSSLKQITRANVHRLHVAWTFDTKETGGLQTSPLIVGRTMFAFTPTLKVIALDASSGRLLRHQGYTAKSGPNLLARGSRNSALCRRDELSLRARSNNGQANYELW